jgi:hypothetical protein
VPGGRQEHAKPVDERDVNDRMVKKKASIASLKSFILQITSLGVVNMLDVERWKEVTVVYKILVCWSV